jgi:hypothetical protein
MIKFSTNDSTPLSVIQHIEEGGTRGKTLGMRKESRAVIQSGEDLAQYSKSWRHHI